MNEIKISDIIIGDRFRKEYDKIPELAASIKKTNGLLQPIVVDAQDNLIAGGRRIRAYIYLELEFIPAISLGSIDETQRRIMELEENIQRQDMSWVEIDNLRSEIHRLMMEKAGEIPGRASKNPDSWNQHKTAEMLGIKESTMSESLSMAKNMELLPSLTEVPTRKEAMRVVNKIGSITLIQEMLKEGTLALPTDFDFDDAYRIGDVFEGLSSLDEDCPELLMAEVDPPYAIKLDKLNPGIDYNEIDEKLYPEFLLELTTLTYRALAPNSWCIFWYGMKYHNIVKQSLLLSGFKVDHVPAIWLKETTQLASGKPEMHLPRGYEQFFVARKGRPTLYGAGTSNVFRHAPITDSEKIHKAERPTSLIRDIIRCFSPEGATILTPFVGSGATIISAYQENRKAFGWELMESVKPLYLEKCGRL